MSGDGGGDFGYVVRAPIVQQLQYALRNAAAFAADNSLAVVPDGLIGRRTVAAVNRALSTYDVGEDVPYSLRSGRLTAGQILHNARLILPAIQSLAPI